MSVILTDQGFVEIGGELTHWDRGYIKQGHKWITRKMKNGKWVYTYKKSKDLKERAEKARKDLKLNGNAGSGKFNELGKLNSTNIDQHMASAIQNQANADQQRAIARKWAAKSPETNAVKDTKAREKLINGSAEREKRVKDPSRKSKRDYQTAEDLKRMQNSARRTIQKENATHHVVKNKVNDWLKKMKNGKWVYTYKDAKADANKYRDQARTNQYIGKEHSNQANHYNNEARRYDRLGLDASEKSAEYRRNTRSRRTLVNKSNKYAELASKNQARGNEELRKARTAYQNSEDAKRMQASAQRAANKKRNASPIHNAAKSVANSRASKAARSEVKKRKKQITDWVNKRKTEKMKKRVKTGR